MICCFVFLCRRVTGELITPATWIRRFVTSHPDYKQDSIITSTIAYDLMMTCQGIGDGTIPCPELLGDIQIAKVRKEDAFGHVLAGKLSSTQRIQLLQSLIDRAQIPRSRSVPRGKARTYSESNTLRTILRLAFQELVLPLNRALRKFEFISNSVFRIISSQILKLL
jgi:hypothetical protein